MESPGPEGEQVLYGAGIEFVQIKDIKGGEYVLSLNEKTGKIEPHKIKGLLDKGVQPIYEIETEDGKKIRTTGNHPYLVKGNFLGQNLNQIGRTVYNLPLNSEGLTELNKFNKAEKTVLMSGGRIRINTIPEYSSGGNKNLLAKWWSKVNNILFSDLANSATFLSGEPKGGRLASNPALINSLTTFSGTSSSQRSFNCFSWEKGISFFLNQLSSVFKSSQNSFFAKLGVVISPNFLNGDTGCQQIQNQVNHNSGSPESGLTATDFGISNNVFVDFNSFHTTSNDSKNKIDLSNTQWVKVAYLKIGDEIVVATDDLTGVKFVKIAKIEIPPPEQVYDIEVEGTHNFVANGIIAHNTYISATTTLATSQGFVGIATSTPYGDEKLTVYGNIYGSGNIVLAGTATSSLAGPIQIMTDKFVVDSSGKVGIGTAEPKYT
ncbi:MAG: hypothetical protein QME68_08450, partial [Elusimicrobiota bacterium]|nr:hypothetical protein [Elusimicrobiota bacterium]